MRLIDADKIHWEYKCISKEEIDDEPTVKAIPIEWIKKWCNKDRKSLEERLLVRYGVITMLEDWEKENADTN